MRLTDKFEFTVVTSFLFSLSPPLESNTGFIPQTDPAPLQSPKQLPKGWVECKDSTTGKPVYVHLASGTGKFKPFNNKSLGVYHNLMLL